ncbi:MAG: biliverdin-producing heme oxygenase [Burkholderiaceae bacterium]
MDQLTCPSRFKDAISRTQRDNVTARLRRITHAAHVRINQHPLLSGLTKPAYPLSRYLTLLTAYYHIYTSIESCIEANLARAELPELLFKYDDRRKLPWLAADLKYFRINPHTPDLSPLRPVAAVVPDGVGALIGMLYVIEGATLGGQVIARYLYETLALTPSTGASFFNGYGNDLTTQRRWQEFGVFASSIGNDPEQQHCAEISAQRVFELIEDHLDDYHARFTN